MKLARTLFLALTLLGCGLWPASALAKWDLSDTKAPEPSCLNCCDRPELSEQCDQDAEAAYWKSFFRFRGAYAAAGMSAAVLVARDLAHLWWFLPILGTPFARNLEQLATSLYDQMSVARAEQPEGIVLLIRAKSDWNFGLSAPYLAKIQRKYVVVEFTAEYLSDTEVAIKSVKERFKLPIKALLWAAHGGILLGSFGSETHVVFGEESINLSNIQRLQPMFSLLEKDCVIIIASCLSAFGENTELLSQGNLAQLVAFVAEGRKVYASMDLATPYIDIDAQALRPRFNSFLGMVLSLLEPLSFFTIKVERYFDLTRCYQSSTDGEVKRCAS